MVGDDGGALQVNTALESHLAAARDTDFDYLGKCVGRRLPRRFALRCGVTVSKVDERLPKQVRDIGSLRKRVMSVTMAVQSGKRRKAGAVLRIVVKSKVTFAFRNVEWKDVVGDAARVMDASSLL